MRKPVVRAWAVPEHLSDEMEAVPARQGDRGEAVPKVANVDSEYELRFAGSA
jgi:hypothetical protein